MFGLVVPVLLTLPPGFPAEPPPTAHAPSLEQRTAQAAPSFEHRFSVELQRRLRTARLDTATAPAASRASLRRALVAPDPLADPMLDLVDAAIEAHAVALASIRADLEATAGGGDALARLARHDPQHGGTGSVRVVGLGPLAEMVAHHRAWLETPDGRHPATAVVFRLADGDEIAARDDVRVGRLVVPITRWVEEILPSSGARGPVRLVRPQLWFARSELFWLEHGAWRRDEPVWTLAREPVRPRRPGARSILACDVDCTIGPAEATAPGPLTVGSRPPSG